MVTVSFLFRDWLYSVDRSFRKVLFVSFTLRVPVRIVL